MCATFNDAARVSTGWLTVAERRCLIWLAGRMPGWITSDHLTGLALVAMFMAGLSYWLAGEHRLALAAVPGWLALNWFGDSLDGTLARVRRQQRPRYGFYVDHMLDTFGILFLLGGLALSGYMSPLVAAGLLAAYYLLSIELYLATYCVGTFQMSYWKLGATELRIMLSVGTIALLWYPTTRLAGREFLLFDVAGIVAAGGLLLTAIASLAGHVCELYLAEPVHGPAAAEAACWADSPAASASAAGLPSTRSARQECSCSLARRRS